ncbi:MAG TPA: G8 domain-containing protein [Gemmataceae bacterium]|nr:G8 domain-containing protein [Gemmataceae bacterium]
MRQALFVAIALSSLVAGSVSAADLRTKQSGPWSAKETWDAGRTPQKGDRVIIRAGHTVTYDVQSKEVIRLVQIAGTLDFARDKNTRLEAGLITVVPMETPSEEGFDCHASPKMIKHGEARPALYVGKPGNPIPGKYQATIRLHYVEGMDKESCPALICCGGRMEIHGEPMRTTWVKLKKQAQAGTTTISVLESVADWKEGDHVVLGSTHRQRNEGRRGGFLDASENEERRIVSVGNRDFTGGYPIKLDKPLLFSHYADESFAAEVANLTRNVVVESADPDGIRGHTMYHKHSAGSISYAEFRHLGKKDVLGRYSIHFHLCGQTMRGSSVVGASIWDSHNRWITIHGTDALVIRDCVGFKSVGHGYFLEDGTEVNNIIDHNAAILVLPGKALPKQLIPFDPNRGAGFWWANCQNSFTRNVAVDCAEYGYRFDCKKTGDYDPILAIRQPDGTTKMQDTRIMPFIRFEDNEAHTMRFFCLNLRGVRRPDGGGLALYDQNATLAREAAEAMPTPGQPFWIRNFKAWEANWSVHLGTTGVFIDGLDSFRNDVAIWRSIMDRSGFRRMTSKEMRVNDIHNPLSMGLPPESLDEKGYKKSGFGGVSSFRDTMPPVTMITSAIRNGNLVVVRGSVADTSDIRHVTVNGQRARSTRGSFAEWEITLESQAGKGLNVSAHAEDVRGHVEASAHKIVVD